MGNFGGHALPGSFILLCGLFWFLRSLSLSITLPLRYSRFWVMAPALMKLGLGVIGAMAEIGDMWANNSHAHSHFEHLRLEMAILMMGAVDLLHMRRVLRGAFWPFVSPILLTLVGLMLYAHDQENELMRFAHQITATLFFLTGVSMTVELSIAIQIYNNQRLNERKKSKHTHKDAKLGNNTLMLGGDSTTTLMMQQQQAVAHSSVVVVENIHPMWTTSGVYRTGWPMCTSILLLTNGAWWWWMGYAFYITGLDQSVTTGMKATHYGINMLYSHLVWVFVACMLLTMILQVFDRCCVSSLNSDSDSYARVSVDVELDVIAPPAGVKNA